MSESKILKAKCNKTGVYFGLELKQFGSTWKVVNFIRLSEDESKIIASEVRQPSFLTNENLIACTGCGNRKVSGCSCSKQHHSCSPSMKYQFDCVYCDSLSIDYSCPSKRSPYTKWAGISNIPDAIKDRYGNPCGSQYDLAQDNSFQGYKVIVIFLNEENHANFIQPAAALQRKGFETILFNKVPPSPGELQRILSAPRTQLWIISNWIRKMTDRHVDVIEKYFNSGHGVYIWGDNDPYYADANLILERLFGTCLFGNKPGDKVLGIQQGQGEPGLVPNHPITTGIMNFYEGITISEIKLGQKSWFFQKEISLKPLMYGSERQVVTAYYDKDQKRALVDGGYTRLYVKWDTAGTDRFIVNSAAWLANIERFGYSQQ